jgi:hypothetical protein
MDDKDIIVVSFLFVYLFVCLFASFTNSRMKNDSQKCLIRDLCTTAKNPQDMASAKKYIDEASSINMHAMKAAIHSTLGSSLGSLTFNRNMFLNIPLIADWHKDKHIKYMKITLEKIKSIVNTTMSLKQRVLKKR